MLNERSKSSRKKVMVIDDDLDFSRLVEKTLASSGKYQVKSVNNPQLAIAALKCYHPDLILVDVIMPEVSGIELAVMMGKDSELRDIPIIFISSLFTNADTGKSGKMIGGNFCLAKPLQSNSLPYCIEKYFESTLLH